MIKKIINFKLANLILNKKKPLIWKLLEKIVKKNCILLRKIKKINNYDGEKND